MSTGLRACNNPAEHSKFLIHKHLLGDIPWFLTDEILPGI